MRALVRRRLLQAACVLPLVPHARAEACRGRIFLSFDTGNMRHAALVAETLARHGARATFFLADEATWPDRAGSALDDSWRRFWRDRVAEGHAFGSHTLRHGRFLRDLPDGRVQYRPEFGQDAGRTLALGTTDIVREIEAVDLRFRALTGRALDRFWRAPGGRTTPLTLAAARAAGWTHVGWDGAGFLGDELPSETHSNERLVARALSGLRDGDVTMAHLGIWSRREPYAPALDGLLGGLRARGFCFETLLRHTDPGRVVRPA